MVQSLPRTNPFPGLRPFELDEEHLFFGREGQADELLTRLHRTRFLAVVGSSGSGKSSLVRAGLLPSLYSGLMQNASSGWRVAIMRPGSAPMANLAAALNAPDVFGVDPTSDDAVIRTALTESTLRRGSLGLVEVTQQARMEPHENLLVVVDQFEELFRFKTQAQTADRRLEVEDEAAAFVKLLLGAVGQRDVPIFVVLTMRSDFLGDCAQFRDLPETLNDSQYLIPRLTREQLRSAIEGPVAVGGATITPRLVNRLLNDTGDNPDQLPILQHALMRTWDYWEDQGQPERAIDIEHYGAIGGMAEALSRHANQIYADLPDNQSRQIAKTLFKCLTERGAGDRAIRRPTLLSELCVVADASEPDVIAVIEQFRAPRRSFLMPPPQVPLDVGTVIDISHESLMRNWRRLKKWVHEETQSAQIYKRLADTSELHEKGEAGYWRDPELTIGLTWQEEQKPNPVWANRYAPNFDRAITFLEASAKAKETEVAEAEKARRQKINQLRTFLGVLFGLSLLSVGFAAVALQQKKEAVKQTNLAKEQTTLAEEQAVLAKEQTLIARGKEKEAKTQREIAQDKTKEAEIEKRNALREKDAADKARNEESRQRNIALEALVRAEKGEKEAIEQKQKAQIQAGIASQQRDNAREAERLALQERAYAWQEKSYAELLDIESRMSSGFYFQAVLASMTKIQDFKNRGSSRAMHMHATSILREAIYQPGFKERSKLKTNPSNGLVFSPNSKSVVSGNNRAVDFWDFANGKSRRFYGPTGEVTAIAYDPTNARKVVTASSDGNIQVWNLDSIKTDTASILRHDGELSASSNVLTQENIAKWPNEINHVEGSSFDSYAFKGNAGESIVIDLTSDQFDTFLVLIDSSNQVIGSNDDSFSSLNSSLTVPLETDGEYTVIATTYSPEVTGRYSLSAYRLDEPESSFRHIDQTINSLTLSADGKQIAAAGNHAIQVWDLLDRNPSEPSTLQSKMTIKGHFGVINALSFSPDGKWLVSASEDNSIKFWDLSSSYSNNSLLLDVQSEITENDPLTEDGYSYKSHSMLVKAGQKITTYVNSGSADFPVLMTIKDSSGKVIASTYAMSLSQASIQLISWKDDEYTIFVGSDLENSFGNYSLSAWLFDEAQVTIRNDKVRDILFSENNKLITADDGGNILEWDLSNLSDETKPILELTGELDSSQVLLGRSETNYPGQGMYYEVHPYLGRSGEKVSFELSSNAFDTYLYLEDPSGNVIIEDDDGYYSRNSYFSITLPEDGEYNIIVSSFSAEEEGGYRLAVFSPDRRNLIIGQHTEAANSISYDPVNRRLASASDDGTIKLWDATNGNELQTLRGHIGDVKNVVFSADGEQLASSGTDNTVQLWQQSKVKLENKILRSRDEMRNWLLSSANMNTDDFELWVDYKFWDNYESSYGMSTSSNCPFKYEPSKHNVNAIILVMPNGQRLKFEGHLDKILVHGFSHDCAILATGSADGEVKLWDIQNERELQTLVGHAGKVGLVYFDSNNSKIISVSFSDTRYESIVWDFSVESLRSKSCGWLSYYLMSESTPLEEKELCQGVSPTQPLASIVPGPLHWVANVRGFLGDAFND